jgi:hypothetical protein
LWEATSDPGKMAKKIFLDTRSEAAYFTLVGISCHLADYRLLFAFNQELEFNFTKEKDFVPAATGTGEPSLFSFYIYRDEDQRNTYYLLANRGKESTLLPAFRQVDYLLIIEGPLQKARKEALLSKIRTVPKVLMASELKFSGVKNHESLLTDLEMHIMDIFRDTKQKFYPSIKK